MAKTLVNMAISPGLLPELAKVTTFVGFDLSSVRERFAAEEATTRSKAEIVELLRSEGEKFAAWLESLSDEFLAVGVTDGDGKTVKTRFERLLGGKEHEMHHRGQLMLVERQLGITPHLTKQTEERLKQLRAAKA